MCEIVNYSIHMMCITSVNFNSHFRPAAKMGKKHNTVLLERKCGAWTSQAMHDRSVTGLMPWKMHRLSDRVQIAAENELFECIVVRRLEAIDDTFLVANPSGTFLVAKPCGVDFSRKICSWICTAGEDLRAAIVDCHEPAHRYSLKQLVLCGY